MSNRGGYRPGSGRRKGSKNKTTIAREAVGEFLGVDDSETLESAIHRRGHSLLLEMERIAHDPTQPVAARIMAARTALPFLLARRTEPRQPDGGSATDEIVRRLQGARERLAQLSAAERGNGSATAN